ncbi:sensor histidine kinase [Actinomadura rupiterrae]|uniref:sensor histidine kinase n=1 Tax=Actinomadura rupiterrae TaxID=559627 RepID=UPI0020A5FDC6|nr:sensor histidine kinase [Actinomadura rupiterrae]MCP2335631.1 signal transduction histidine kinase [Actinomadura rupiterrae]
MSNRQAARPPRGSSQDAPSEDPGAARRARKGPLAWLGQYVAFSGWWDACDSSGRTGQQTSVGDRVGRVIARTSLLLWGLGFYLLAVLKSGPHSPAAWTGLAVTNLLAAGGLAWGLLAFDRDDAPRWSLVPLGITVLGGLGANMIESHVGANTLVYIATGIAAARRPGVDGAVFTAGAAALLTGTELIADQSVDGWSILAFVGVYAAALALRERRGRRRSEANEAALAERSRMAREIHDILAHSLSAQIVHLEGARLLLSRDGDRERALERVERAQRLARTGLEETRRALAALRGEAPPLDEALAELADEYRAATGRPAELEITGTPYELTSAMTLAFVRTAQEALTNVRKHAPGASVRIVLAHLADAVELTVTDTGGTEDPIVTTGGGYGLVGMRERAELVGGTLEAGPDGKGFRVALRIRM